MPMDKRTYRYEGATLHVGRTSSASATVELQCGMHEHESFIIGLLEAETGGLGNRKGEERLPVRGQLC